MGYKEPNKEKYAIQKMPDPAISQFPPAAKFGSVSDKFHCQVEKEISSLAKKGSIQSNLDLTKQKYVDRLSEKSKNILKAKYQSKIVEAMDHVGVIAAQSIGEPSTQMTLNTFHSAGRSEMNVTLGIPRLREILMTASLKPKTPFMDIEVLESASRQDVWTLSKKLNRVIFSDIIEKTEIKENFKFDKNGAYRKCRLKICLVPSWYMKSNYSLDPTEVLSVFESDFINKLTNEIKATCTNKYSDGIEKKKSKSSDNEDNRRSEVDNIPDVLDDSDSDDEEKMDGELTAREEEKLRNNREENEDQDSGNEDDEESQSQSRHKDDLIDSDDDLVTEDEAENEKSGTQSGNLTSDKDSEDEEVHISTEEDRKKFKNNTHIISYRHGIHSEHPWIEVTLKLHYVNTDITSIFQSLADKVKIREVAGINRSFITKDKKTQKTILKVEGINIEAVFDRGNGLLDLDSLYSNDIEAIRKFYGVDAAVLVVQKELEQVFGVYDIQIDPRHLSMVADYMCTTGKYLGFNRRTLYNCRSPWLQMSFEAALMGLKKCVMQKTEDCMISPSARIVTGQTLVDLSEPIYQF